MINLLKELAFSLCEYEMFLKSYRIGDSNDIITIHNLELVSIKGREYLVFRYQNKLVKIHKKYFCSIYALDEDNIKSLIGIPTKRILLPEDCLYDIEGKIQGYVMQEIKNQKKITHESMDHILEETYFLYEDKELLTREDILLTDFNLGNVVYNGQIYIVDSGRYSNPHIPSKFINVFPHQQQLPELTKEQKDVITTNNRDQFNRFIYFYLLISSANVFNRQERLDKLNNIGKYLYIESKEMGTDNYLDVIESRCDKSMTVDEYVKSLMKKIS